MFYVFLENGVRKTINTMKKIILTFNILLLSILSNAQIHRFGDVYDPAEVARTPQQAELLTRDYTALPSSYSLRKWCPIPKSQGDYGTCTSWSTAYYARTICEARNNNWTDKQKITSETFSPTFVYTLIKKSNDYNCSQGASTMRALEIIWQKGVPKLSNLPYGCNSTIASLLYSYAEKYKSDRPTLLFDEKETNYNIRIRNVKKALSEDNPVLISFQCYDSFDNIPSDVWNGLADNYGGGHSICVIGYDDNKYGGAFEIINSWGVGWANQGYCWIRYNDFCKFTNYAAQMNVKKTQPIVNPTKNNSFSGSLKLQLSTGEEMRGTLSNGIYKISGEYISGTRYRIYISNNEPAYVYVIGSDLQNNVSKVFPPNDKISPALTYKNNNIAIPDEKWFVQMDNTIGKDYICVLYSAEEVDINSIINKIRNSYGSFYDKVSAALSGKIVPISDVRFSQNAISFSAQSNKKVVAIIAEVVHK